VTPYVPYTMYVLAYTVLGTALGSLFGGYDLATTVTLAAAIWFGLEGLHAIDLADDGVGTRFDNRIARALGYAQVAIGVALGVVVAVATSYAFLVLVSAGAFLGLAYNEEWFGGLLHDRDKKTGLGNFGLSWGAVPFLAGVTAMAPGFLVLDGGATVVQTLGVACIAVAVGLDAMRLNYLEGHGALPRYDDVGLEHDREHKSTCDEARGACHWGNVLMIPAWVAFATGAVLVLVVGEVAGA